METEYQAHISHRDDPLQKYLKEIAHLKPLSAEEEAEHALRAAQGDTDARNKLFESSLHLVVAIAKRFMHQGIHILDLIQEGNLALLKAIEKFDPAAGVPFSRYASMYIRQALTRLTAEQSRNIRIPADKVQEIIHECRDMDLQEPDPPTHDAMECRGEVLETKCFESVLPAGAEEFLDELMDTLTEREADVIRQRYGLDDDTPHTEKEVAENLDIPPSRVRQIEYKALRKMRRFRPIPDFFGGGESPRNKGRDRSWFSRKRQEHTPEPTVDNIQFRAAAPAELKKGRYFLVKIMAYPESDYAKADREQQLLGDRVAANTSGIVQAHNQETFQIRLFSEDFPMEEKRMNLTWNGTYASTQTDVMLPADFTGEQVRLVARIYSGIRVVSDLILILEVQASRSQEVVCQKHPVRTAFISYASKDRDKVLARIQGLLLGREDMDLFLDKKDIRRGEFWEKRLYREIDTRDIFYLFWSTNARDSEWVQKELAYAIEKKGSQFIEPVPLEDPEICPPPKQLGDRHFCDWTLRYMGC